MAAELPPYRPGMNYVFTLERGLLYRITFNELLILRKTLNDSYEKGVIYINNCLVRAPILFLKKEGGFWFYVDYWGLNNITKKDYYP